MVKKVNKSLKLYRYIAIIISVCIVIFIILSNTAPFNITRTYFSDNKHILLLGPKDRVKIIDNIIRQKADLVYFNSPMSFNFDHSKIKIVFKNTSPEQQILLGYKDQETWHYNLKLIDNILLDNLNWNKVGNGPYLYQKKPTYNSVGEFLNKIPENKIIGVVDYKKSDSLQPKIKLPNYQPANTTTSINTPLRGKTTLYAFLNHEPFNMSFTKQDLNWYTDPDVTKISVFKGKDKVFDATVDDDGNTTGNHKIGNEETVEIKNPGPGLPESGVYKIVIDASDDSLITNISTTLHKISFEGPLYVADNHEVYGNITPDTKPTNLITNAQSLSFRSDHNHSTIAKINQQTVNVNKANQTFTATSNTPSSTIAIPNSDMIVNGSGYFAFNADQFFVPIPYKILPINSAEDIAQADYILTDYKTPRHEGDWLVAEREFDLQDAAIQKGQLSWLLSAPGLKENNHIVEYKQIDVTLTKKGWFKQ
jgi:hypothetical protein